jgi:c-di-GMP-binding flagellar brake protein YcgR
MTTRTEEGKVTRVSETELEKHLSSGRRDDRRGNDRLDAKLEVVVSLTQDELRETYTSNISRGGMMFSLRTPASLPGEIDVTLVLPGGAKVTLRSEVRHVARSTAEAGGGYDVGVQFRGLDADSQRTLDEVLTRLGPSPH